ncbi:MAG: Crp/Fnr family transcriptional regulator [Lentihominibacter sp.]|nr:Crp/Fnr family transcriptional regulator [Bacillota bacterium]MDD7130859.1 Crp/Fnr family transcriptional regulator [Bacillota bacterium]MDY5606737.1 Crp/Fnr family transcriptional regulator [Lentihominibacter sp.]
MKTREILKELPYWKNLTQWEKELVAGNTVVRTYEKGEILHGRGESCMGMLHILSGSVRVHMISDEGREITLFHLNQGDSCILSASCSISQITFETHMVAMEDTEVMVVNSGIYSALMEQNLNVRCFTYELATRRFSTVVWVMQQILFKGLDCRLAGFLLESCAESGKDEVTMTQEEIAREINSAREAVARMMKIFSRDGLIEVKRGLIIIKDKRGLETIVNK